MLRPTGNVISVFAHAIIFLGFFSLGFAYYSSASEETSTDTTEDIVAEDISALIQSASQHVNETAKAIENGNSTEALALLAQIPAELNNINGNITDLIFSVSKTPP
jgi:hypothetical protein